MQHNVLGITGPFGSGKTLYAVQTALHYCEKGRKPFVSNFPINVAAAKRYARERGMKWVANCARFIYVELASDLDALWKYKGCVFVFDEAGVMANSRGWKNTSVEFLTNLFQVRKLDYHLLVVFQFESQIDNQMRQVIQHWVRCKSLAYYDPGLKAPRIVARIAYHYNVDKFFRLQEDVRARGNLVLPWFWAERVFWRVLTIHQLIVFAQNRAIEIYILAVYLSTAGGKLLRLRKAITQEDLLFAIFRSTGLVGRPAIARRKSDLAVFIPSDACPF